MSQSTPSKTTPEQNKALVLEAFDTLFNRRDYDAAERFWSDRYIQHSAHIAPGRDGLFNLKSPTARFLLPLRLESGAIALGETVAFLSSVIPAEAGIQRPKTRHSPLDSRLRGNDGNREVGEPKCLSCP